MKHKLTSEQVELLKLSIEAIQEEIDKKKPDLGKFLDKENALRREVMNEINSLYARIDNIKIVLSNSEVVVLDPNSDIVDIGSLVTVAYDDEDDVERFILIENNYNNALSSGRDAFVTLESPMGKAVFGKKKGDICNYKVVNKDMNNSFSITIKDVNNGKVDSKSLVKN